MEVRKPTATYLMMEYYDTINAFKKLAPTVCDIQLRMNFSEARKKVEIVLLNYAKDLKRKGGKDEEVKRIISSLWDSFLTTLFNKKDKSFMAFREVAVNLSAEWLFLDNSYIFGDYSDMSADSLFKIAEKESYSEFGLEMVVRKLIDYGNYMHEILEQPEEMCLDSMMNLWNAFIGIVRENNSLCYAIERDLLERTLRDSKNTSNRIKYLFGNLDIKTEAFSMD